jgi:hypothetical protein
MKNVVSLDDARLTKVLHSGESYRIRLWRTLSDFERFRAPGAVLSPHDPILLGERSEEEVRAMLLSCGIRAMPRTYAELFGLYSFCEQLAELLRAVRAQDALHIDEMSELFVDTSTGDVLELLQLLLQGQHVQAAQWHLKNRTLERCTHAKIRKLDAMPSMRERLFGTSPDSDKAP